MSEMNFNEDGKTENHIAAAGQVQRVVMLPCPFCGRNAGIYAKSLYRGAPDVTYIQCFCGASLDGFDNERDAVNAWNKRAV